MSVLCGLPALELFYCLAWARWFGKKWLYTAGNESENWGIAGAEEFDPVPRMCRFVLAVYEDDLQNPIWAPPGGYGIDPEWVILRKNYEDTQGQAPPYIIYLNHDNEEVVLAVRGLNLGKERDFAVLLDDKLGQTPFDGGYVHNGLLKAARWVLDAECEVLKELLERNPSYKLTFAGHSLGSGVVTLLSMVAVQNRDKLGSIERQRIRCYAMAPARCVSLNLAVRYADIINAVVLQDDFLPRTTMAFGNVFRSLFCLPCLLCLMCLKDACTLEDKWLTDPRRLYAPGRLYHIVDRKCCRMGRYPPVVRTAVPVDGRFEHVVLSCNATTDHSILRIEKISQQALDLILKRDQTMDVPSQQIMEQGEFVLGKHREEHKGAPRKAVALSAPFADSCSSYGTFSEMEQRTENLDVNSFLH